MYLTVIDIIIIVSYMVGLSLIGIYFSQRQTSRAEYFLGDRKMYWFLAGGSVLATILSTISYLSVPGEVIRYGVAYCLGLFVTPLIIPIVNRVLIPSIVRLPITSAYQYLGKRFDRGTGNLASTIFVFKALIWMGIIIYTASFAFSEISGLSIFATIVILGVITTFYTSVGGFRTVIWTDNLQLWILLAGALSIPAYVAILIGSGPLGWWEIFSRAGSAEIQVFSFDPTVRITVIGVMLHVFFWNICANGGDQVALQRYLSTPSIRAARRSVWVYAWSNVLLYSALSICGLALFAYYAHISGVPVQEFQVQIAPEADRLMPRFIVQELPSGISGLVMAALLAAAMSSLSSGINSISGVLMSHFLGRRKSDQGSLSLGKWVAVLAGFSGIGVAVAIALVMRQTNWNILDLSGRVNDLFVGPLAVLFFGGILFRRAGKRAITLGFLLAVGSSLFISFSREWFGLEEISWMWVVPVSFAVGLLFAGLLSLFFAPPSEEQVKGLTLSRELMRGKHSQTL